MVATITAVDEHGAARSLTYTFEAGTFPNAAGAPSLKAPGLVRFAQNVRGSAVLPAATGGDTRISATDYPGLYLYHVSGLPPGLSFDPDTRTISGTPTTAGTWTATYTADDYRRGTIRARTARPQRTRPMRRPGPSRCGSTRRRAPSRPSSWRRWSSRPAHSSGNNNVYDTYVRGDEILIDVQYDRPVAASLPRTNSRISLRLDVGRRTTPTLTDGSRQARQSEEHRVWRAGAALRLHGAGTGSSCARHGPCLVLGRTTATPRTASGCRRARRRTSRWCSWPTARPWSTRRPARRPAGP